jgi:hypothetical protein
LRTIIYIFAHFLPIPARFCVLQNGIFFLWYRDFFSKFWRNQPPIPIPYYFTTNKPKKQEGIYQKGEQKHLIPLFPHFTKKRSRAVTPFTLSSYCTKTVKYFCINGRKKVKKSFSP